MEFAVEAKKLLEEQNQVAMRVSDKGQALFFDVDSGAEQAALTCRSRPAPA